jgi:hypothetical protein
MEKYKSYGTYVLAKLKTSPISMTDLLYAVGFDMDWF